MTDPLEVVSYGGGVQSNALLALAATGRVRFRHFVFANVGDDSEDPLTLRYVRDVARPYAERHGLDLVELARRRRDGTPETLYGRLTRDGSRSLPIPVRMADTGAPGTRNCTADFKIKVIGRHLRDLGASPERPATVAIGFSTDEVHRCNRKKAQAWERPEFPLIDLGLSRAACLAVIRSAGLPEPPKSACWFCPFHARHVWAEMRRDRPALFQQAVDLERLLIDRRTTLGRDPVYLTRYGRPLPDAVAEAQPSLFGDDGPEGCDEGHCWT